MRALNNKIGVVFDETDKKFFDLGNGIKLERAESWKYREGDEDSYAKVKTNENHLETNPQIAKVIMTNDKYKYKKNDIVFLHYLAFETFEDFIEIDGEDVYLIDDNFILFTITDEGYELPRDAYLGESVIEEAPKTASGIYLTPDEHTKDDLLIRIKYTSSATSHNIGTIVVTIDKSNYPIEVKGEKLFYLKAHEIVGVKV